MSQTTYTPCFISVITEHAPDDCTFCGKRREAHVGRRMLCAPSIPAQSPHHHYHGIGHTDYEGLSLALGLCVCGPTGYRQWFDATILPDLMTWLFREKPLLVSYRGVSFLAELLWSVYTLSTAGQTRQALNASAWREEHEAWLDLWQCSFDFYEEILAAVPDLRGRPEDFSLDVLGAQTLGTGLLFDEFQAARLYAGLLVAPALNCQERYITTLQALFARVCDGQPLKLGDGAELLLPIPLGIRYP